MTLRMWAHPQPGERIAIACDGETRHYRVTGVRPGRGGYDEYDLEPADIEVRRCRYCRQEVILGKRGWRLDSNHPSGYDCPSAPRGYHGTDKPGT